MLNFFGYTTKSSNKNNTTTRNQSVKEEHTQRDGNFYLYLKLDKNLGRVQKRKLFSYTKETFYSAKINYKVSNQDIDKIEFSYVDRNGAKKRIAVARNRYGSFFFEAKYDDLYNNTLKVTAKCTFKNIGRGCTKELSCTVARYI